MNVVIGGDAQAPSELEQGYCLLVQPARACEHWPHDDTGPSGQLRGKNRADQMAKLKDSKPCKTMKNSMNDLSESASERGDFTSTGLCP